MASDDNKKPEYVCQVSLIIKALLTKSEFGSKAVENTPPPAHTMLAALGLKKGLKCKLNLYPRQKAKEKLSDLFAVVQTVPKPPEILKYKIKKINIGLDN